MYKNLSSLKPLLIIIMALTMQLFIWGCDPGGSIPYTNESLYGCYAMNNEIFNQLWFDGISEFVEIYWTSESGEVSYGGNYRVSQYELRLDYYDYDPEVYELVLYTDGFTLDGTPYYYVGYECR